MRWLLRRLAKVVSIDVSPERFVFECGGSLLTLETRLWVTNDRIEAVGADGPPGCDPFDLFPDEPRPSWKRDLPDLLSAFLQHGIVRVMGRGIVLRPIVRVTGLASFEKTLGGYQKAVFEHALEASPAAEVRLDDRGRGEDV